MDARREMPAGAPSGAHDPERLTSPALKALLDELQEARSVASRASADFDAAQLAWQTAGGAPARPLGLALHSSDYALGLRGWAECDASGRYFFNATAVEFFRRESRTQPEISRRLGVVADGFTHQEVVDGVEILTRSAPAPWPESEARAQEIVVAWDWWVKELTRSRLAFDLPTLFAADEDAGRAVCRALDAVCAFCAQNTADLVAKARVALQELGPGEPAKLLEEAAVNSDYTEELGISIIRDLVVGEVRL